MFDTKFRWGYPETDKRLKKIIKEQAKEIRKLKEALAKHKPDNYRPEEEIGVSF